MKDWDLLKHQFNLETTEGPGFLALFGRVNPISLNRKIQIATLVSSEDPGAADISHPTAAEE